MLIYWKHYPSFGPICGKRLICSSSDGVAPFKVSLVCVCACPNSESCFPWKEPPCVKHSHTGPPSNAGSVNYQTLLWGITVNHCKTGRVLLGSFHGSLVRCFLVLDVWNLALTDMERVYRCLCHKMLHRNRNVPTSLVLWIQILENVMFPGLWT